MMHDSISKPYLGDMDVVGGLVRGFLASVVDRLAEVGAVREGKGVAAMADQQACLSMAAIFLGKDPKYEPVRQWNSGGGMVDWMYEALDHYYKEPESNRAALLADVFAQAVMFISTRRSALMPRKRNRTTCRTTW
jgi:hypothetical protein